MLPLHQFRDQVFALSERGCCNLSHVRQMVEKRGLEPLRDEPGCGFTDRHVSLSVTSPVYRVCSAWSDVIITIVQGFSGTKNGQACYLYTMGGSWNPYGPPRSSPGFEPGLPERNSWWNF